MPLDSRPGGILSADSRVLLRALNALGVGLALYQPGGALVHRNRSLAALLEDGAEGAWLQLQLDTFVQSLQSNMEGQPRQLPRKVSLLSTVEVNCEASRYCLRGSYLECSADKQSGAFLIRVDHFPAPDAVEHSMTDRFQLTRQEARIARLLAQGKSNAEIAAELVLSSHTARNYTRRVLAKLQVRSRSQVGPKLLKGTTK